MENSKFEKIEGDFEYWTLKGVIKTMDNNNELIDLRLNIVKWPCESDENFQTLKNVDLDGKNLSYKQNIFEHENEYLYSHIFMYRHSNGCTFLEFHHKDFIQKQVKINDGSDVMTIILRIAMTIKSSEVSEKK